MNNVDGKLLIETNRRLQETVQQLLIAEKEHEKLLNKLSLKNLELEKALDQVKKQSVELIQTAKMASLGVFAGGVAHELNNPLMAILNYVQFCLKHVDYDAAIFKVLQDIESETKRCTEVIKSVLTFLRLTEEGEEVLQNVDLLIIVKRILTLLDYRIEKESVEIKLDFPVDGFMVFVRQNMMQRAILTIVLNALDAVQQTKLKMVTITGKYEGAHVVISVADTGCGIKEENMSKLFSPFFTTKEAGKSVGMGLVIVQQIVESHRGKILCNSKAGFGTTFTISLPSKAVRL